MDPSTAALIGAGIGGGVSLLSGTAVPWIREAVTRRSVRRETNRAELRISLVDVMNTYSAYLRTRQEGSPPFGVPHNLAAVSASRLAFLLSRKDAEVESLLTNALNLLNGDSLTKSEASMGQMQKLLHRWFRGEIPAEGIVKEYSKLTNAALAQLPDTAFDR